MLTRAVLGCVSELQTSMGAATDLSPAWILAAVKHFAPRLDTLCHIFLLQPKLITDVLQQGEKREPQVMVRLKLFYFLVSVLLYDRNVTIFGLWTKQDIWGPYHWQYRHFVDQTTGINWFGRMCAKGINPSVLSSFSLQQVKLPPVSFASDGICFSNWENSCHPLL